MFLEKGVLKIFSKFTGEHPCQSVISINLLHIFRTPFNKNFSGWLLLNYLIYETCKLILETILTVTVLQTHHVDSTLKRRGNGRFHVVSTWNPRGVFVGVHIWLPSGCTKSILKSTSLIFKIPWSAT